MTTLNAATHPRPAAARPPCPALPRIGFAQEGETETHGLSSFGDLKYPPDFKHFDYVNPHAPKGGTLAIQIKQTLGNQNFDTFNTLNIFVLQGRRRRRHGRAPSTADGRLRRRAGRALRPRGAERAHAPTTSSPTASCCARRRASTTARG